MEILGLEKYEDNTTYPLRNDNPVIFPSILRH